MVVSLVLALAASAYADPGKGKGKEKVKFKANGNWKAVQLADVGSHWAEQPIQWMCAQGILAGYPDLTFRPNVPVTKFEAIMMISKASGFSGSIDSERSWSGDVPAWMEECLNYSVDEGILTEDEAASLKGWVPAKRYEVAVWAARAMGVDEDGQSSFQDLSEIPFYARPYVGGMFKHQFMIGYPGNVFQPNKPVTRAELSVVLYRILLSQSPGDSEEDQSRDTLEYVRLEPADGSDGVDPSTSRLVARFNLEVRAVGDNESVRDGIRVRNLTDKEDVEIDRVSFSGKELRIDLDQSLESDMTYRVTIARGIIEDRESGQTFRGIAAGDWEFSTTDSVLEILQLTPRNGASNVNGPGTEVLEARFNREIQVVAGKDLLGAIEIYNRTDRENVEINKVELDQDTLLITLEEPLVGNSTFEVTIKQNYLEDELTGVRFEGIDGSDWKFTTR